MADSAMIVTFFEWIVGEGRQAEFREIWHEGTELLLREGSLGSALFIGDDGHFRALARWPDRATRDAAFARTADAPVFVRMRDCVEATLRREDADELDNLWRFP
jgi:hypothetical protein